MQSDGHNLHTSEGEASSFATLNGNAPAFAAGIKRPREGEHDDLDVLSAAEGPLGLSPTQRKRQAMTAATPPPPPPSSSPPVTIAIQDLLTSSSTSQTRSPHATTAPPFATYMDITDAQPTLSQGTLPPLAPPSLSSSLALPSSTPLLIDPRQLDPSASAAATTLLLDNVPSASSSSTASPSPPSSPPELFASPADVPRVGGWIVPRRRAGWETPDVAEALRELLGTEEDKEDDRAAQGLVDRIAELEQAMQEDDEDDAEGVAAAAAAVQKKRLAPCCNPWRRADVEDGDLGQGQVAKSQDEDAEDEPLFAFLPQWRPSASVKVEAQEKSRPGRPAPVGTQIEAPPPPTSSLPSTLVSGLSSRTASSSTSTLPATAATAVPATESGPSSPPRSLFADAAETAHPAAPPAAHSAAPPDPSPRSYNGLSRSTSLCLLPRQEALGRIAHLFERRADQDADVRQSLAKRVRDGSLQLGLTPVRGAEPDHSRALDRPDGDDEIIFVDLGNLEDAKLGKEEDEGRKGEHLILALGEDSRIDVISLPRALANWLRGKSSVAAMEAAIREKVEMEFEERRKRDEEEQARQLASEQASSSTMESEGTSQPQPQPVAQPDGQDDDAAAAAAAAATAATTASELATLRTTLSTLETTHASLLTSHSTLESRLASAQSDVDLVRDLYQSSSNLARTASLEAEQLRSENATLRTRAERGVAMHAERYRVAREQWELRERDLVGQVRVLQGVVAREEVVRGRREEARERAWQKGEEERERVRKREERRLEELRELQEEAREEEEREEREMLLRGGEAGREGEVVTATMKVDDEPEVAAVVPVSEQEAKSEAVLAEPPPPPPTAP